MNRQVTMRLLEICGNHLAKKERYRSHTGLDAVRFYLVNKYHWLPSQVDAMSFKDLRFVMEETLKETMEGWTPPKEAR